jgi:hypothetical protein
MNFGSLAGPSDEARPNLVLISLKNQFVFGQITYIVKILIYFSLEKLNNVLNSIHSELFQAMSTLCFFLLQNMELWRGPGLGSNAFNAGPLPQVCNLCYI